MTMNCHLLQALLLLCMVSYTCQATNAITCHKTGPMKKHPSSTSGIINYVNYGMSFPCNCYISGRDAGKNVQWFRVNVDKGAYGYISSIYCSGDVKLC
ncbi:unnamed protein product [Rotaria socialis]|uniref:SH3 domain-containing protein n=1 Tax=Rotaria socialis TaxID=392032 RepID=A0A818C8E1_9BILA|nr:unnamed protein product [Rotaria socialis]